MTTGPSPGLGLFDGYEGHRTPSDTDYKNALVTGLVVPDTNVLLNLYRYTTDARGDLLEVLTRIGDRLWIPPQVAAEFWGAREAVLGDPRGTAETRKRLVDLRSQASQALQTWANRIALEESESTRLKDLLDEAFNEVAEDISVIDDSSAYDYLHDTATDPVLAALERILDGRVGRPPDTQEHAKGVAEGRRRLEARIPPGYMDKAKGGDGAVGDYLVWSQTVGEAQRRCTDVVFVTADLKEDWWHRAEGRPRGPRLELFREMYAATGRRLFMLRPDGLLHHARNALSVNVADSSVEDVERVSRLLEENGWTAAGIQAVMRRLADEAPVQAEVVRRAAELDGSISREEVYRIGGYAEERSLRGFTRPVRRVTQEFQERGLLPPDLPELLVADYDERSPLGSAIGFSVPSDVVLLLAPLGSDADAPPSSSVQGRFSDL
ncbi:PIN domain-containing protein [Frankia sp. Ag45/Mut15]|uniref:PIN domain-containing protein n=1 Tax=Frankia umida TaxID=573489 RepID=A0ABT0K4P5_9ACTN|nr:PIN-like domain-containing protein [Frankia umida]MCK9878692.1 PIN domain-containing protein [Frankia umida]